jgi:hypothetical protein
MKSFFSLLWLLASGLASAGSPCNVIPGKRSYAPLKVDNGVVCFVEQPLLDDKGEAFANAISIYLVPRGLKPVEAKGRGLMYDYDAGKVVDAFSLDINHDGKNELVVIHYHDVHYSQAERNSSGIVYSVYVFNQENNSLNYNNRVTEWFGSNYSWLANGENKIYEFPYLTRQSVQKALSSPFISLMYRDEEIPVIVKKKSYLYEHSMIYGKPTKYLIAGDKATVDKYTAGWCQVNYTGGKKPLQMWMMCDALEVDTEKQ